VPSTWGKIPELLFVSPFWYCLPLVGTTQESIWNWRVFKKRAYLNTLKFFKYMEIFIKTEIFR
jgi:hypothetical protein